MPDPVTVSLVVGLLVQKFSENLGADLGSAAAKALSRFVGGIEERLRRDPAAGSAVERLQQAPNDAAARQDVERAVERRLTDDAEFRHVVEALVTQIRTDPGFSRFAVDIGGNASVGKVVQIERVEGDVSF
ncbi:MAG TPA: hypothetical protein VI248_15165 [Kineosporiaceae bacterium]